MQRSGTTKPEKNAKAILCDKNLLLSIKKRLHLKIATKQADDAPDANDQNDVQIVPSTSTLKSSSAKTLQPDRTNTMSRILYSQAERYKVAHRKQIWLENEPSVNPDGIISPEAAPRKNVEEYALTSEVTLCKTGNHQTSHRESNSHMIQDHTPNVMLTKVNVGSKKKLKKKRKRFRNLDGSDDEDDWPLTSSAPSLNIPTSLTSIASSGLSKVEAATSSSVTSTNAKEKIQILSNYIIPSPTKRSVIGEVEENVETSSKDKIVAVESEECSNTSKELFSHSECLDDVRSAAKVDASEVVLCKEDIIDDGNGHALETRDETVLELDAVKSGEIFCVYDDLGNLVCLQKDENGQLIMLPTNEEGEEGVIDHDNNNSFEVESKRDALLIKEQVVEKPVLSAELSSEAEDELLKSSRPSSPTDDANLDINDDLLLAEDDERGEIKDVVDEFDRKAAVAEEDEVLRENDVSPGTLVETVENIGNEEIVAESQSPEEEIVTLPGAEPSEPIYILNENEPGVCGATPLETAFITTLQSLAQSATAISVAVSPETRQPHSVAADAKAAPEEVVLAPISTDLETLLRAQDQCRIVDYTPSDLHDQENLDESISSVNGLSQMDIAKMVLGEGLGARLVSDQEQAVDLLQLPPDYTPKPVVLKPVVPVSISPLIVDGSDQVKPRQKRPYNRRQAIGVGATSTPVQKVSKKRGGSKEEFKRLMINHVTGDSEVASPMNVPTPTGPPQPTKERSQHIKSASKTVSKLNGSPSKIFEESSMSSGLNYSFSSYEESISRKNDLHDVSVKVNAGKTHRIFQAYASSRSDASVSRSAPTKIGKRKKTKRKSNNWGKRPKKIAENSRLSDANNSSKENNSLLLDETLDSNSTTAGIIVGNDNENAPSLGAQNRQERQNEQKLAEDSKIEAKLVTRPSLTNLNKDDSLNSDISLGTTSSQSPSENSSAESAPAVEIDEKTKKKRKHSSGDSARITRSTSSRPMEISQVNLCNAEVSISTTEGVQQDRNYLPMLLTEDQIKLEPPDSESETADDSHPCKTPQTSGISDDPGSKPSAASKKQKRAKIAATPNGSLHDAPPFSTPKSATKPISKFPFKINFKNLIATSSDDSVTSAPMPRSAVKSKRKHRKKAAKDRTPSAEHGTSTTSRDFHFEAEIKIKDELLDADDDQPKVPKIILKLSPHASPSIVRAPSCSPRKSAQVGLDGTPRAKSEGNAKKRLLEVSPKEEDGSPAGVPKKKSNNVEEVQSAVVDVNVDLASRNDGISSSVLYTDDPELSINFANVIPKEDLEAEMKTENFEDDEADLYEVDPYHIGDLVLGRLGSFCFWPCMVTREPIMQKYRRRGGKLLSYHVRFFGDCGRRAWLPKACIIRYDGPDTLTKHDAFLRHKKANSRLVEVRNIHREIAACKVNGRMRKSWLMGMAEQAALVDKTVTERHDFFFEMFATQQEKTLKRKRLNSESLDAIQQGIDEVAEMPVDTAVTATASGPTDEVEVYGKPPTKKRKVESKKASTPKTNKKHNANPATPSNVERKSICSAKHTAPPSSGGKFAKSPKDDAATANEQKRNYVIEDLELIIKGSLVMQDEHVGNTTEVTTLNKDTKPVANNKRRPLKRISTDEKRTEKGTELRHAVKNKDNKPVDEISDTDSSSKISVQSISSKRIFFRDVSRNPVCHICYKSGGNVLKCKGSCFGFYHPECSQFKKEPQEEEEVFPPVFLSPATATPQEPTTPKCSPPKVEIVSVKTKTKYFDKNSVNLNQSDVCPSMDLMDQLDSKLSKIMAPIASTTNYHGSTTDSSSEESTCALAQADAGKIKMSVEQELVCINCSLLNNHSLEPPCFACGGHVYLEKHVERFRCSVNGCGKYFHRECLKCWPQAVVSVKNETFAFKCPMHNCQTCTSDNPHASTSLLPPSKSMRCLKCPATYHMHSFCVPAGTEILSHTHIICPRHVKHKGVKRYTINANWCFICSRGGDLMCCETCPTSVHAECISINLRADDTFVCEDCESGRLPLYDEIVWAKFAQYKWWPAVILFPEDIPENVRNFPHKRGEFVVRFYGTHDHHWFALGRVFLFQEDDIGDGEMNSASRKDHNFQKAVAEAKSALVCKKQLRLQRDLARRKSEKPPPFTKIRVNRMVGHLKPHDGNVSNTNACNCNENMYNACGPYSDCLNRLLLTECDPEVCPARAKCQNQRFEKRLYPPLVPYKTETRGWGLKCTEPLFKGQFIIEYVGEVIDQEEYHRRIATMNEQKAENYYFLTLDGNRTIDAGPKGNVARFMNHCCKPNCETQKWTVRGNTRVGLFASEDISPGTELTFNYNMETIGDQRKVCRCGAENCSGFLGVKNKEIAKTGKPKKKTQKIASVKKSEQPEGVKSNVPCFICSEKDPELDCTMKNCSKVYHVKCLDIFSKPQGKWTCPRHYCNACAKRTIRSCIKCLESYCPMHSSGKISFHKSIGYVCNKHNPDIISQSAEVITAASNALVSPTPIRQEVL